MVTVQSSFPRRPVAARPQASEGYGGGVSSSQGSLRFADVPLSDICAGAQPRTVFDPAEMAALTGSIADLGLLQPLLLTPHATQAGAYTLVAGERRLRCLRDLGRDSAPSIIRAGGGDHLLATVAENTARTSLNALEEAGAYRALIEAHGLTHEQVAAAVGKSRSHISHLLALGRLPLAVQRRVAAGLLSTGHAKVLLSIADPAVVARLAERIVAEGLSVASTAELVHLGDLPGGEGEPVRVRVRRRPVLSDALVATAGRLSDALDTTVRIHAGRRSGRVVIHFAGEDDLDRIMGALATLRAS